VRKRAADAASTSIDGPSRLTAERYFDTIETIMIRSAHLMLRSCVLAAAFASAALCVDIPAEKLKAFAPLPAVAASPSNPITKAKVELGRMLYFEPRLSRDQKLSCNSCHDLAKYGVDNEPTSTGFRGQHGDRNAPTVYNAAAHFVQFWDGRAKDVEAQAVGPMMNPVEMAMPSEELVVAVLKSIPEYVEAFKRAFPGEPDPVNITNAAKAIGAFERELMTPSRWDAFLKGDQSALSEVEKEGFLKFVDAGCAACHNGALLGGNSYKRLGIAKAYPDKKDIGVAKVSKKADDRFVFKVPSLRNITKTGPYFHNGSVPTLDAAVTRMAEYQLGKPLSPADVKAITTWMNALTGRLPEELIRPPKLPASTDRTPKPVTD
jgi:cytochrome c peroxidase